MEDMRPILEHDFATVETFRGVLLDLARGLDEFSEVVGCYPSEGTPSC